MLKLKFCVFASVACVLSVLYGCASEPAAADIMSRVHVGMTKNEVIDRLGPPDGNWGPWHSECIEYGFQKYGTDRYALYVNNQGRVIDIEHANCSVKRAESLGLR